ncbi:MAG: hypothetical protein ACLQT7_09175 [Candidatus Dormibacteria bacterium]
MKASYLLVLGLAVVAAGCGSTAPTSTSVPPTSTPAASGSPTSTPAAPGSTPAAVYYAGAAASVDAAYVAWTSAIAGSPEPSQLVAPAAMYAGALTTFDNVIVDIGATGSTASDIATLVSDDQTVIKDLNQISNVADSDLPTWEAQLSADGGRAITAGDVVRADLGLPPS